MLNKVVKNTPEAASCGSPPNLLVNIGVVDAEGSAAKSTISTLIIFGKSLKILINKIAKLGIRISRQNTRVEIVLKETVLFEYRWAKIEPTTISASGIVALPIKRQACNRNCGR